ncbi:probable assembly chaperone of rpl4 isoform X2 [Electrophorus electricus]|uniref:probable assembly chaperone of rpl4 isoform X2 n=1 Tax=Electrophorus electricus TaxID=8005 RepID=UPI0015D04492|nr:probable assembly chaperone of rpl4 isoform X2 [Electrophorus electricus]
MGGQAKAKKKSKPKRKQSRGEHTVMSPQERMKARMQDRAKKKTAEKYTVDQLLEKAEDCMDNFDFSMARMFCRRALDIEPTNLTILDMLGNICAELGDIDKAKEAFLKAVELSPEAGHGKYMYLGQIHTGKEAVQYFSRGVEVMLSTMDAQAQGACGGGAAITAKDVSVAFCSIAEIFFTDLCMEDGAADKCKETLEKALQYDQHSPEALQLMASYLFSLDNTEEGCDYLRRSVSSWLPSLQKEEVAAASAEEHDQEDEPARTNIPPYESRITTAKLLIEAEQFEMATEVLEGLLEEDDEVVQVWYLLGWLFYLQLDKPGTTADTESFRKSARTYLTKAKKLYVKLCCEDPPLLEHTEQLLGELGGEETVAGEDDGGGVGGGPSLDDIADDFVQSSDDDEEEDAMEH